MERDENEPRFDSTTSQGNTGGVGGTQSTSGENAGLMDRARDIAGGAQDRLADVGSAIREKTGGAKDSLADALESGADKLRQRVGGGQMAGATATGGSVGVNDGRVAQISDRVASGMDATAEWLREADLDSIKVAVERQVREHPGRTLLIAAGLGYLIGKAFRSNR